MSSRVFMDAENQGAAQTRNAAKQRATTENQAQKRTALGQITNNIRQQPARAAKLNAPFKVYEDKENASAHDMGAKAKSKKTTQSLAVSQKENKQDSASEAKHVLEDVSSPMSLDVSTMDATETVAVCLPEESLYCLPEYQDNIHDYLREAELRFRPKAFYMRKQTDISAQMRTILVDWLVEVGEEYKLHDETLHLAVNYIDRFLSQMSVMRAKLQLVGTACMFLASKFEEIYPPDVGEFVYITDDTYTKKQLLRMEHLVIKVLGFSVAVPTSNVFLDLYCKQLCVTDETLKSLAQYIVELSLLDCDNYLVYMPSKIASSALFLACHILPQCSPSISHVEQVTRYSRSDVSSCVQRLFSTLKSAPEQPQQAVREKYQSDLRRAVSTIPIPDLC